MYYTITLLVVNAVKIIAGKEITLAIAKTNTESFFFHSCCIRYFLLVLFLAPRGFSPGIPVFPFPENNISNLQFDLESGRRRTTT